MKLKQKKYAQAFGVIVGCIVILVSLCGCTSNQNTNETKTQLSGTWVGTVEIPMSGGMMNTSLNQITFTSNTAELTLKNTQRSSTMNYTFTVNGTTLVLQPTFSNMGGFPGQPPQNGTRPWNDTARPPMNGTFPTNGTRPPMNGTLPLNSTRPGNFTRPENGTWNPIGGQQPMSMSFTYSLNEEHTVLYLNGAEFRKVQ
jgi:hypothetical protein